MTEPGARSNGTVVAESQEQAEEMAAEIVNNRHGSAVLRVTIVEPGNRSTTPTLTIEMVNEELGPVVPFTVDVASEFVWALTAVFACFAIVLLPAFAIYAVSRRRERADEAKLAEAEAADVVESDGFGKNEPRKSPRPINRSAVFSGHAATVDGHRPHVSAVGRISPTDQATEGRSSGVDLSVEILRFPTPRPRMREVSGCFPPTIQFLGSIDLQACM